MLLSLLKYLLWPDFVLEAVIQWNTLYIGVNGMKMQVIKWKMEEFSDVEIALRGNQWKKIKSISIKWILFYFVLHKLLTFQESMLGQIFSQKVTMKRNNGIMSAMHARYALNLLNVLDIFAFIVDQSLIFSEIILTFVKIAWLVI